MQKKKMTRAAVFALLILAFLPARGELIVPQVHYPPLIKKITVHLSKSPFSISVKALSDEKRGGAAIDYGEILYLQGEKMVTLSLEQKKRGLYEGTFPKNMKGENLIYSVRFVDVAGNITMTLPVFSKDQREEATPLFFPVLADEENEGVTGALDILSIEGAANAELFFVRIKMKENVLTKESALSWHPFYVISFATAADEYIWDTGIGRFLLAYMPNLQGLTPFGNLPDLGDAFIVERDTSQRVLSLGLRHQAIAYKIVEDALYLTFPRTFAKEPTTKGWMATFMTGVADDFQEWNIPLEVPRALRDMTPFLRLYVEDESGNIH